MKLKKKYDAKIIKYYEKNYPKSDIDLYFTASDDIANWMRLLHNLNDHLIKILRGKEFTILRTTDVITFVFGYPKRNIQIVIGAWRHKADVLVNCDIDCSAVGYDGTEVLCIPRSEIAFNRRWTMVSDRLSSIRGKQLYTERLVKYSNRGFKVVSLASVPRELDAIAEILKNSKLWGYAALQYYHKNCIKEGQVTLPKEEDKEGLPYGPEWPLPKLIAHIQEVGYVYPDNYGTEESGYDICDIESIADYICRIPNIEKNRKKSSMSIFESEDTNEGDCDDAQDDE